MRAVTDEFIERDQKGFADGSWGFLPWCRPRFVLVKVSYSESQSHMQTGSRHTQDDQG